MKVIHRYLGDGVYVAFNGWQYVLTTGAFVESEADNVIYLEPSVIDALNKFIERVVKGE